MREEPGSPEEKVAANAELAEALMAYHEDRSDSNTTRVRAAQIRQWKAYYGWSIED